jgi:hypothetical protein
MNEPTDAMLDHPRDRHDYLTTLLEDAGGEDDEFDDYDNCAETDCGDYD